MTVLLFACLSSCPFLRIGRPEVDEPSQTVINKAPVVAGFILLLLKESFMPPPTGQAKAYPVAEICSQGQA